MKLITESLAEQLLANGRAQRAAMDKGDDALDFGNPSSKLFTPRRAMWLGEPELGYASLLGACDCPRQAAPPHRARPPLHREQNHLRLRRRSPRPAPHRRLM